MMRAARRTVVILMAALLCWPVGTAWGAAKRYSVFVASYQAQAEAEKARQRLEGGGLAAYVRQDDFSGLGVWFRVFAGPFYSRSEAESRARELDKAGVLTIPLDLSVMDATETAPAPEPPVTSLPRAAVPTPTPYQSPARPAGPPQAAPQPLPPPPPVAQAPGPASGELASDFYQVVEGGYVASYRYREEAERQAEGLTLRGWPAKIVSVGPPGAELYRVYMVPPDKRMGTGLPAGFAVLADMSATEGLAPACQEYTAYQATVAFLRRLAPAVPRGSMYTAVREHAFGAAGPSGYSRRVLGPEPFDAARFDWAATRLAPSAARVPLELGFAAVQADLAAMPPGRKVLFVISDFDPARSPRAVEAARRLASQFGGALCIYPITMGQGVAGAAMARDLAGAGNCGTFFDGCLLLADAGYFESMVLRVFYREIEPREDSDKDGVPDGVDQCPNTPLGAPVDSRGCWVAAFAQYFDFNKAEVKPQFVPNLRQAATILRLNPLMPVVIAGHTDNRGSAEYNHALGLRRANAVARWLMQFGVEVSRISVASYGETRPIDTNATEAGRARNRRVEFEGWDTIPLPARK